MSHFFLNWFFLLYIIFLGAEIQYCFDSAKIYSVTVVAYNNVSDMGFDRSRRLSATVDVDVRNILKGRLTAFLFYKF